MIEKFIEWLKIKSTALSELGIILDDTIESSAISAVRSYTIFHTSQNCIGQITLWEESIQGLIDIEVLDADSGKNLLYEHIEIENMPNFDLIFVNYIKTIK